MRIAITGSSGLVGTALVAALRERGDDVVRLVRRSTTAPDEARWDPERGDVDLAALGRIDAVVHLAGENIAGGRWSEARKRRIHESRGPATEQIGRAHV